jgi:hypothetical protein
MDSTREGGKGRRKLSSMMAAVTPFPVAPFS